MCRRSGTNAARSRLLRAGGRFNAVVIDAETSTARRGLRLKRMRKVFGHRRRHRRRTFSPCKHRTVPCHLPRLPYVFPHEIRHRDYNYRNSNFNTRVRTRCGDFLTERRSSTTGRRHPNPAAVPGCNHDYRELNSKLRGHDGRAWLFHRRCSSSCCRSCLRQPGTPCRPAASLSEHRAGSERIRSRVSFCLSRRSPS